jgi:nitric oxide reductase
MTPKKLWLTLAAVIIGSFAVLCFYGVEIFREMPPFPNKVVTESGETLFEGQDIKDGQNVWQSIGGQTVGSVWGHGAYVAPDWTADYLHRESELMLAELAKKDGKVYNQLDEADKAKYKVLLQKELRKNTYDAQTGIITFSKMRAKVAKQLHNYYAKLFLNDPSMAKLRNAYAMRDKSVEAVDGLSAEKRFDKMDAFFAWSSWVCVTNRPNSDVSYTNNWPHDPVIGNVAPTSLHLWSGFSVCYCYFSV